MSKAVARKEGALPAISPEDMYEAAGAGHEEIRKDSDVQIPTLVMVQLMSPQLQRQHAAYVEGSEAGDIVHTLTGQLWKADDGIEIIPVHFRPMVDHVKPKSDGKADYIATYSVYDEFVMQPTTRAKGSKWDMLPDDETALMGVAWHYVIPVETMLPVVIRMKRSSISASKLLNSMLEHYKILELPNGEKKPRARFATRVLFKTSRNEKDGNVFWVWAPQIAGDAVSLQFYAGRDLHTMVKAGEAVAMPETPDEGPF